MDSTESNFVKQKTDLRPVIEQESKERKHALEKTLRFLKKTPHPITFEIGCGNGHYLTAYAKDHPEKYCIGIDVFGKRLKRSNNKKRNNELQNLCFIKAEATEFIEVFPKNTLISEVFILFPDPWPKRKHHKNRLIQPDFLTALAMIMEEGAPLHFRTDDVPYFDWTVKHLKRHPLWSIQEGEAWPFEAETLFQTRAHSYSSLTARKL